MTAAVPWGENQDNDVALLREVSGSESYDSLNEYNVSSASYTSYADSSYSQGFQCPYTGTGCAIQVSQLCPPSPSTMQKLKTAILSIFAPCLLEFFTMRKLRRSSFAYVIGSLTLGLHLCALGYLLVWLLIAHNNVKSADENDNEKLDYDSKKLLGVAQTLFVLMLTALVSREVIHYLARKSLGISSSTLIDSILLCCCYKCVLYKEARYAATCPVRSRSGAVYENLGEDPDEDLLLRAAAVSTPTRMSVASSSDFPRAPSYLV